MSGGGILPAAALTLLTTLIGTRETASKLIHLLDRILRTPGITPLLRTVLGVIDPKSIGKIGSELISFISSNILVTPSARKAQKQVIGTPGVPVADMDVKIVDEDTGERIPIEKVVKEKLRGEYCLKGPQQMVGYWPDAGSGFDEEGYIHTGDVVTMDEWGQVYIQDRTKDMINVSGYKVYSIELDDLLYKMPGICEAATIGIPDPERLGSERVKIFVSLLPGYEGKLTEEDIIEYLRDKVPKYAVPKSVEIRDELPKTVAEKIFKKKLREEEIEKMKREGLLK
jgi:acyl-CoA synthetase (AMP-forming)/AMP-acid ligase II